MVTAFEPYGTHELHPVAGNLKTWLSTHRDPYLWHCVIRNLEEAEPVFQELHHWMVTQPEFERAHAIVMLDLFNADYYVGKPAPDTDRLRFETLSTIVSRSIARDLRTGGIGLQRSEVQATVLQAMTAQRQALLDAGGTSGLEVPEWLLTAPVEGAKPSELARKAAKMDAAGIWDAIVVEQDGIFEWRPILKS